MLRKSCSPNGALNGEGEGIKCVRTLIDKQFADFG